MIKFFGGRLASALVGISALAMGSSATAQNYSSLNVSGAVKALDVNAAAKPLGSASTLVKPAVAATTAVANTSGTVFQAEPAQSVTVSLAPSIAKEAEWLRSGGWHLAALVDRYGAGAAPLGEQANCIAVAVYHEARGETVEGQLAVARVIMNRAASGKYPGDWCGVVKQPWQFSFVNPRTGAYPSIDEQSASWRKALGITRLAINDAFPSVEKDVLWYHATYVAPSWGRRLQLASRIGTHIFYRA